MTQEAVTFDDFCSTRKRQQRITMAAAVLGLVICLLIAYKFFSMEKIQAVVPGTLAKVQQLSGTLLIKRGADTVAYTPGFIVLAGDMFQTLGDASVTMTYLDDGTKVTLGPDTTFLFNGSIGGKSTNLSAGEATFVIPDQPEDMPMVLASYNADATVLRSGTFIQKYNGLATHYAVQSGQIEVRRYSDGHLKRVGPGQTYTCRPADVGVIKFNPDGLE